MVNYNVVNLFPTSIYVGEVENHVEYKEVFYSEIYSKYQFPHENERGGLNTSSVNCGKPVLHHERKLEPLFRCLTEHMRSYCQNVLMMSCLLYTSPSPRDRQKSRMPSSA